MVRTRLKLAPALVTLALFGSAGAAVAAGGILPGKSQDDCAGLACAEPGSKYAVPEASGPATRLDTTEALERQKVQGFYDVPVEVPGRPATRMIAYVVAPGAVGRAPASIRRLPVVEALAKDTPVLEERTVLVLGPDAFIGVPRDAAAAAGSSLATAPSSAAVGPQPQAWGDCPNNYFCLFNGEGFTGTVWGSTGTTAGWLYLSGFDNDADSMVNRRNLDSKLNKYYPPSGAAVDQYCADSVSEDASLSNNFGGGGNNQASAFANSTTDSNC